MRYLRLSSSACSESSAGDEDLVLPGVEEVLDWLLRWALWLENGILLRGRNCIEDVLEP